MPVDNIAVRVSGTDLSDQKGGISYRSMTAQSSGAALRRESFPASLPFRFSRLHVAEPVVPKEQESDTKKLGRPAKGFFAEMKALAKAGLSLGEFALQNLFHDAGLAPVHVTELLGHDDGELQFALEYDFPMGSVGSLSSTHADLSAKMMIGWGPSRTNPSDDGVALQVQLPSLSAGSHGFNLQGLIRTAFGDAAVVRMRQKDPNKPPFYAILFANVSLEILKIKLPPGVHTNFMVFADPTEAQRGNVGWYLAVTTGEGEKS